MQPILADLVQVLKPEQLEDNLFRGVSRDLGYPQVFGGQVLGQALAAASATVAINRSVHSLHAYFLLPGDVAAPIIYEVDRSRDGGSFSSRRVVAIQHGHPIFHMSASFQVAQAGLEHQSSMPQVPRPEAFTSAPPPATNRSPFGATVIGWRTAPKSGRCAKPSASLLSASEVIGGRMLPHSRSFACVGVGA